MKRALMLLSMMVVPLFAACGDDDGEVDMSTCGPTTCSASQFLDTKTCMCANRDMAVGHD
jgi:hypothetical protein